MLRNMNVSLTIALATGVLAAALAFSQEGYRSDAAIQFFGTFVTHTVDNGVPQSATNSGGLLASYRLFLSDHHGLEVNYGESLNTQSYLLPGGPVGINARSHEITATYLYRHPFGRLIPFVEAGGGSLVFVPKDVSGASSQAQLAFVYGGGVDYNVTKRVFVRAAYRGLIYDSPTFANVNTVGLDRETHRAEPSVGFGYRF